MIRLNIKLHANNILNNPRLEEKIQSALAIGEYSNAIDGVSFDHNFFLDTSKKYQALERKIMERFPTPEMPVSPARDSSWVLDTNKGTSISQTIDQKQRMLMILDATYIDVEINAMEASSALIIMDQSLPIEFYKDFGLHISDEARHAVAIAKALQDFPDFISPRTYSNRVWNKIAKGNNILERIMIENVIEEGSAADKTVRFIQELKECGLVNVANLFSDLNQDEIRHASIGNKWAMRLLNDDEEEYFSMFEKFSMLINPEARQIESIPTRLASGFSKKFIKRYF